MKCKECGGKLIVIETMQVQCEDYLLINRERLCTNCKIRIKSHERIKGAIMNDNYKHGR